MRSNVVASYPSPSSEVRGPQYDPRLEPRTPDSKHHVLQSPPTQKSKRQLVLAPSEGWLAMLLLAIAVYSVVFSIISANWVSHTFILLWSTAFGLLIGLLVAKIRHQPQAILHIAACLVGHWLSVWLTSIVAFHVSWGILIQKIGVAVTDPTGIHSSEMVFLFYLSFLCFFLGYFGAWLVYRMHLPWLVAFVYCSILVINLNYTTKQDLSFLVLILLAALILLIARVQLVTQLIQWKSEGLHTDRSWLRDMTGRFMQIGSIIALLTLLVSVVLPVAGQPTAGVSFWDTLENALTNISQGHLSLQNPGSLLSPYQPATNFFGDQLAITGSVHLPSGEVLYYTSTQAPQYLEGFTYDHFDGHTWTSAVSSHAQNYNANALLPSDTSAYYTSVTTSVTVMVPPENAKHYIFAPAQPVTFDVSTTLYGDAGMTTWTQQSPLLKGEHYQATSFISTASPQDLSTVPFLLNNPNFWQSDPNYSTLQTSYLQIPPGLSSNVKKTVQQWTRGATNPYAALKMLEAHLSDATQFTYSVDNAPVPGNVNAVDWLLQTRRGYCTYYATAMTVMARMLGIPTRMANGFSGGHLDPQRNVWAVQGSDAHSWVQAYFPNYGWINFDPTPGYALNNTPTPPPVPTVHPTQPVPTATPHSTNKGTSIQHPTPPSGRDSTRSDGTGGMTLLLTLSLGALLMALLILLAAFVLRWWRNLYPNSSIVAGTYWRICRVASWVGLPPPAWQTPYEYSSMLSQQFPQEAIPLWRLTELFVRERWASPHEVPQAIAEDDMVRLWPTLRRVVFRLIWRRRTKRK